LGLYTLVRISDGFEDYYGLAAYQLILRTIKTKKGLKPILNRLQALNFYVVDKLAAYHACYIKWLIVT